MFSVQTLEKDKEQLQGTVESMKAQIADLREKIRSEATTQK